MFIIKVFPSPPARSIRLPLNIGTYEFYDDASRIAYKLACSNIFDRVLIVEYDLQGHIKNRWELAEGFCIV